MAIELAELILSVRSEATDLYEQMEQYKADISVFGEDAEGMLSGIKINALNLPTIVPTVDHKPLVELNAHLKKKGDHVLSLNRMLKSNPIKPVVDMSDLDRLSTSLSFEANLSINPKSLAKVVAEVELNLTSSMEASLGKGRSMQDGIGNKLSKLTNATKQGQASINKGLRDVNASVNTSADALLKKGQKGVIGTILSPLTSTLSQLSVGFNERVGASFADPVGRGATSQFQKLTGIDLAKVGAEKINEFSGALKTVSDVSFNALGVDKSGRKEALEAFRGKTQKLFEGVLPKTGEIQRVGDEIASIIGDSFLKASFKLGDGIAATFGAKSYFNMGEVFFDEVFDLSALKSELKDVASQVKKIDFNVFPERESTGGLSLMGEVLDPMVRSRRMQGLRIRAVPLVEERTQEIVERKKTSGRNATVVRRDDIDRLVIAIGGYAQARGLSGARIAKQINAETGENTHAIFVKNPDTDLGSAKAAKTKRQALMMSLLKPNLRGFSPDSIEMAAQAAAARQMNPEVKINLIGESGGGFVVEEVAEILKMMGIDDVEDISVGTPDFVGRLNRSGERKILSPDEPLGEDVFGMIAPKGLLHADNPRQNVIGVRDHQFEYYRDARTPELMNAIFGQPEAFSREEIEGLKADVEAGRSIPQQDLGVGESMKVAFDAIANSNDVKRRIDAGAFDGAEELDELKELAKELEAVYVKFVPESADIRLIRKNADLIEQNVEDLETSPDFDAEAARTQLNKAQRLQSLGREAFTPSFGTEKIKFEQLDERFTQIIKRLNDILPSSMDESIDMSQLSAQTPEFEPVVVDVQDPLLEEYQQIGKAIGQAAVGAMKESLPELFQGVQIFDESILSKIDNFRDAAKQISDLSRARPKEAESRLEMVNKLLPNLLGEVDEMIKNTPVGQRMSGDGALAANAKSQLIKLTKTFEQLQEGILPNKEASTDSLGGINKLVTTLGGEFKEQIKAAKSLKEKDPEKAQKIARELLNFKEQYVALLIEFEKLLTTDGVRPKSSQKAISNARRAITVSTKDANKIVKETEAVGVNAGEGFNQGLQSTFDAAKGSATDLGQLSIDALKSVLEVRSPSRVAQRIGAFFGEGFEKGLDGFKESILESIKGLGVRIAGLFAGFKLIEFAGDQLLDFGKASFDAALNAEKLQNTFRFVTGSARMAAEQIARIREESNTLGTNATQGLEGFSQLASSTRGTSLEGFATEQLSSAIQQAASVSQLDTESLNRANIAISQISGKGTLSSEELKGQLAEVGGVFAGSFQIASRAIGVTTAELNKMLQRGEVLSESFLPKFAQQLAAETATGVAGAANTARAAINRVNNQMTLLREQIGAPLADVSGSVLNVGADLLERLIKIVPIATSLFAGLAASLSIKIGGDLFSSLGGLEKIKGFSSGKSFGDISLAELEKSTFGDRVFDKGIDFSRSIATTGVDDLRKKAVAAKLKLMELKDSSLEVFTSFRGKTFGSISGDNLERGGVGLLSSLAPTPSFGDISVDELLGKSDMASKSVKQRFSDSMMGVKNSAVAMREAALESFAKIQESGRTTAISLGSKLNNAAVVAEASFKSMGRSAIVSTLNLGKAAAAITSNLLSAVAPMLALTAAIEGIKIGVQYFSDLSGEIGKFVESADNAARQYEVAIAKMRQAEGEDVAIGAASSVEAANNQSPLLESGGFTGFLAKQELKSMRGYRDAAIARAEEAGKTQADIEEIRQKWERNFQRSSISGLFSNKAAGQQQEKKEQLNQRFSENIDLVTSDEIKLAASRVRDIDSEISSLTSLSKNEGDLEKRQGLQRQIGDLQDERVTYSSGIALLSKNLAEQEQSLKGQEKLLNEQIALDIPTITLEDFNNELSTNQALLDKTQQAIEDLGESIRAVTGELVKMENELSMSFSIASDMESLNTFKDSQDQLALSQVKGELGNTLLSRSQAQIDTLSIDRQKAVNRFKQESIVNALDTPFVQNSFDALAGEGISKDMGFHKMIAALDETKLDNDNVDALRTFAEKSIELEGLKAEAVKLDSSLFDVQADLRKQARELSIQYRDLSREISRFYDEAYRNAEQVANTIASQDFQNATQEISNEIQRELIGLEKSFVSGISDTFTGLIESLRQPLLDELNAINERNGIEQEFRDAMRSAEDLQRQADEFDFDAGFGPDPTANLPQTQSLGASSEDFIIGANGKRWPKVIDLTAEQAFGGGSFMGEPSYENTSLNLTPSHPATNTNGAIAGTFDIPIRNDDIAAANDLAQRSRDEQLAAIDRNLATQADTASLEVDRAIHDIARQLEEGRKTISEQSSAFARSLRDGLMEVGTATPMRELEKSLIAVSDQFNDTNKDLEAFKDGLKDTITETSTVRAELLAGVAAGTVGQEALAILPDLDRTIAESQAALATADSQIEESRNLLESQRAQIIKDFEDAERDRRKAAQRRIVEGRGALETARIENFRPSPFRIDRQRLQEQMQLLNGAEQESVSIALEFDAGVTELDDLLKAGELTKLEYGELKENLIGLNEIKLDGLRNQFESLLPTVDSIVSALNSARGEFDEDSYKQIEDNLKLASASGALTEEQASEARSGLRRARDIAQTKGDNLAVQSLMGEDNAFTGQFLSQLGRGDLVDIANLGIQNQQAESARRGLRSIGTDPEALANELTRPELAQPNMDASRAFMEGSDRMVAAMEKLTMAIAGSGDNKGSSGVNIGQQVIQVTRSEEEMERAVAKKFNKLMDQNI